MYYVLMIWYVFICLFCFFHIDSKHCWTLKSDSQLMVHLQLGNVLKQLSFITRFFENLAGLQTHLALDFGNCKDQGIWEHLLRLSWSWVLSIHIFLLNSLFISWSWRAPGARSTQPTRRNYPKRFVCLEHPNSNEWFHTLDGTTGALLKTHPCVIFKENIRMEQISWYLIIHTVAVGKPFVELRSSQSTTSSHHPN